MPKNITKSLLLAACSVLAISPVSFAREGLWNPANLKKQQGILKKDGLLIPVNRLYDTTKPALNNAVVLFGNGCTASFISGQGLLLTNHHCGYGYAQRLSTPEHNFLKDGFWAMNNNQEIPCPGLTITITRKMVNVTDYILKGVTNKLSESERGKLIQSREEEMSKAYEYLDKRNAKVVSFYGGNEYWIVETTTFKDVRMVAFPPNSIGNFGADMDNWMWPRETGDFSLFRVYADQKNQPAAYSTSNVPYKPDAYLPIASSGMKKGDLALVYGFPYVTEEYLTSYELERVKDIMYPIRVDLRGLKLALWDSAMSASPAIFLKYAAKQAAISNGYKKWKGALQGLASNHVMEKKQAYESFFQQMAAKDIKDTTVKMLLPRIHAAVEGNKDALYAVEYSREAVMGVEIVKQAYVLEDLLKLYRKGITDSATFLNDLQTLQKRMDAFYKDYVPQLDKRVFEKLMPVYMQQNPKIIAPGLQAQLENADNNFAKWASAVVSESILAHPKTVEKLFNHIKPSDTLLIHQDPDFLLYDAVVRFEKQSVWPEMRNYEMTIAPLHRAFIAKQMQYPNAPHAFYPDANQTLRLSYGKVEPLQLPGSDSWQTNLGDLVKRNNPQIEALTVPEKLLSLYQDKDFGKWSENGIMPVNFLTTAQTTGGNSGSPVLNAKGQLIGLNFDRPWQGTMSDIYYSDKDCRNISVDIRYVMFLIQQYGHAGWLLKEMKFVK